MTSFVDVVFNLPVARSFTYRLNGQEPAADTLVGCRARARFGQQELTGFVIGAPAQPPDAVRTIRPLLRIIDKQPLFDSAYLELARWMAHIYMCSLGEALSVMLPGASQETAAAEMSAAPELRDSPELSAAQRAVVDRVCAEIGRYYLYGATGSGKTEVFLHIARRIAASGGGVIYLTPEIALTQQVAETIHARFDSGAAILHSRLTAAQRLREWRRIQRGEARIVIGARSAIFAPLRNLALIIVDEEHEAVYKSSSTPRYHARQVALYRSRAEGARLIMGSATPSVEAWKLMQDSLLTPLRLDIRLSGGSMPTIEVVDMRSASAPISQRLEEAILQTHAQRRQTILFLNRRGFSYRFYCPDCGYELLCRNCSVALTYHKQRGTMLCHYCGFRCPPPTLCPQCASLAAGYGGYGTERIEEEIKRRFPKLRIERADTDSVRRRGELAQLIHAFRAGEIDLLLGTQMIAKGLNFPGLRLVGILLADTGLTLPDFRAQERTFALITQVAGRAGRFSPDGEVIIQTYRPQNSAIRLAAEGAFDQFYRTELELRRELRFPPFARLFRLVFRGIDETRVEEYAFLAADLLKPVLDAATELLGPAECPIGRIARNHRRQLLLRTTAFDSAHARLYSCLQRFRPPKGVHVEVDIDPTSLL